jgi:hypothetical protein
MGKHNKADYVLTDKRKHSNIFDVRFIGGTNRNTDRHLVAAKFIKRPSAVK